MLFYLKERKLLHLIQQRILREQAQKAVSGYMKCLCG